MNTQKYIDMAVDLDIIQKSGTWYSYDSTKLGQGRESVKDLLSDNPEMALELETKIKNKVFGVEEPVASTNGEVAKS